MKWNSIARKSMMMKLDVMVMNLAVLLSGCGDIASASMYYVQSIDNVCGVNRMCCCWYHTEELYLVDVLSEDTDRRSSSPVKD